LLGCVACRESQPQRPDPSKQPAAAPSSSPSKEAVDFAKASNALGFELYRSVGADRQGNVAIAPSSVSVLLAMIRSGAAGKTQEEMTRALHVSGPVVDVAKSAKDLLSSLNALNGTATTLRMAGGLFVERAYKLQPAFLDVTRQQSGVSVESLGFKKAPEGARKMINSRVAEQTERRISEILPKGSVNEASRLVLTNAVYFLGSWVSPFSKSTTARRDFHLSAESMRKVPMMSQHSEFNHVAADGVQVLELPYKGNELSMLIVLPDNKDGLSEFEGQLTAERFEGWAKGMKKTDVQVVLPRFELHSATQLKKPLEEVGIKLAFDQGKADFRGMSAGGGLYIQDAYHDVFVRVDETGTEAAAATAAVAHAAGLNLNQTRFIADHPFLFVIRHRASGALVFLGRVVAPGT